MWLNELIVEQLESIIILSIAFLQMIFGCKTSSPLFQDYLSDNGMCLNWHLRGNKPFKECQVIKNKVFESLLINAKRILYYKLTFADVLGT